MTVTVAPATQDDGKWVARHMRELDRQELRMTGTCDPWRAIRTAIALSDGRAVTAFVDGEPAAVFGAAPSYMLGEAMPWMLGTDKVGQHARELIKGANPVIDGWLAEFPLLMNEVWIGNRPAVRFLRHVGFSFAPPRQNEYGADMALFYMRRSYV